MKRREKAAGAWWCVGAALGMAAAPSWGAVQLSSMQMSISGGARFDGGTPPEFQSYVYSGTAPSDVFEQTAVVNGADARSGVQSEAFAGPSSPPLRFDRIRAAGWAEAWSMPGRQAWAESSLRASFAMTESGWVDLETVGRAVIDVYKLSGGSVYNLVYRIEGETSTRVFMGQGFWKIDASVRMEDPVQGYGTFRMNIPSPGGGMLAMAGLGAAMRRRAWRSGAPARRDGHGQTSVS